VPLLGIAFVGEGNEDSEATIAAMGEVKRLGRLPRIERLNAQSLAIAFAANFRREDFAA
jgi:dethiobiotin synthetase